jgi:hypothetical protein
MESAEFFAQMGRRRGREVDIWAVALDGQWVVSCLSIRRLLLVGSGGQRLLESSKRRLLLPRETRAPG